MSTKRRAGYPGGNGFTGSHSRFLSTQSHQSPSSFICQHHNTASRGAINTSDTLSVSKHGTSG